MLCSLLYDFLPNKSAQIEVVKFVLYKTLICCGFAVVVVMVPCRRWRRWPLRCPLKPLWAVLGSRYPFTI